MDLHQLRCFVAAANALHFGRAAQQLDMMPSALGRAIRLLEDDLGTRLLTRTTRSVALTEDGAAFLKHAQDLLGRADLLAVSFRERVRARASAIRVGAIDSAAAGLLPELLQALRGRHPGVTVKLVEDKTIRLLPQLLSGRLDLVFVRPPASVDQRIELMPVLFETAVVAVAEPHPLAARKRLTIADLAGEPLIVPDRRSRPHSHDLTMKLFAEAGLDANVRQIADEKQTIVNLVAAGIGVAIVPRWTARMATRGVVYVPITMSAINRLPLSAAWLRGTRDPLRDDIIAILQGNLARYAREA